MNVYLSNDDCSVCWTSVGRRVASMKSNGRSVAPVSSVVGLGLSLAFAQVQSSGNGVPHGLDLLGWGVVGGDGSGNWVLDESAADGVTGHQWRSKSGPAPGTPGLGLGRGGGNQSSSCL